MNVPTKIPDEARTPLSIEISLVNSTSKVRTYPSPKSILWYFPERGTDDKDAVSI